MCMVINDKVPCLDEMASWVAKGKMALEDGVPSSSILQNVGDLSLNVEVTLPQVPMEVVWADSLVVDLSQISPIIDQGTTLEEV